MSTDRITIRGITIGAAVAAAILIGLMALVGFTATRASDASRSANSATISILISEDIENGIREYQRLGNLAAASGDIPGFAGPMADVAAHIEKQLAKLKSRGDPASGPLLAKYSAALNQYMAESARLFAGRVDVEKRLLRLRPSMEAVLLASENLQANSAKQYEAANRRARDSQQLGHVVVATATFLVVAGIALLAYGTKRLLLCPIRDLDVAMKNFRRGGENQELPQTGIAEMRRLTSGFNILVESIRLQRRDQLTFLAAVAHDLRNPLAAMKLNVQFTQSSGATLTPEKLGQLDAQLDRLNRMVSDLLDAVRIESGNLELKMIDVDLRQVAQTIVDLYAATTSHHELKLAMPEQPVVLRADPLRLEQLLGNLVSNAIKYSAPGTAIEVIAQLAKDGVELMVRDQGPGLSQEDIDNLFLPFRRRPMFGALPGVGLGLFIVRRLALAHGGTVDVESTLGTGTLFRVWLPRSPEQRRQGGIFQSPIAEQDRPSPPGHRA